MAFGIWERTEARRLPLAVRAYMRRRFMLTPDYVDHLRCFELDDVFHDEPARRVRIFSPEAARSAGLSIRTPSDLSKHPELILFEGYTNELGTVYIADRRMPAKAAAATDHAGKTTPHGAVGLRFSGLAHLRKGESVAPGPTRPDAADSCTGHGGTSETHEAPNKETKEDGGPASRRSPSRKLGSYGPGAGWQPSRDTRDERAWLRSWDRVEGDEQKGGGHG